MDITKVQKLVRQFTLNHSMDAEVQIRVLELVAKVGNLANDALLGTAQGTAEFQKTDEWNTIVGDIFFTLICLANDSKTDLEDTLRQALTRYEKKRISE